MRACPVSALFFSALLVCACSPAATDPPAPDAAAAIPHTTPSIVGQVTAVALPMVAVEEKPAEQQGSAKASVRVTNATQVLRQGQGAVSAAELRVGQRVKVWFTGPVMESYPLQATAGLIVIEPDSR